MWPPRWSPSCATSCFMSSQWHHELVLRHCESACCWSLFTSLTCWYHCWYSSLCCCPPLTIPTVGTHLPNQRKESDSKVFRFFFVTLHVIEWFILQFKQNKQGFQLPDKNICSFTAELFAFSKMGTAYFVPFLLVEPATPIIHMQSPHIFCLQNRNMSVHLSVCLSGQTNAM